jgi:hypothetical protein
MAIFCGSIATNGSLQSVTSDARANRLCTVKVYCTAGLTVYPNGTTEGSLLSIPATTWVDLGIVERWSSSQIIAAGSGTLSFIADPV